MSTFLCALSFKGTKKWARKFPNLFFDFFEIKYPSTQFTIWIVYWSIFDIKCFYSCILKGVPVLCLVFFSIFRKTPFYVFTSQKSSQILRESRCSPLSNMVRIEKTSYGIHLNIQHKNLPSQFRKFSKKSTIICHFSLTVAYGIIWAQKSRKKINWIDNTTDPYSETSTTSYGYNKLNEYTDIGCKKITEET